MHEQFKVLIAEDDLLIADTIEDRLVIDGFEVCGIATTIAEGIALAAAHEPDIAIVDIRLADGDLGTVLASELKRQKQITILYATGNVDLVLQDEEAIGEACITKPYSLDLLSQALILLGKLARTGALEAPVPEGLILLAGLAPT
jgi:two-component system, response regulator PdtaR